MASRPSREWNFDGCRSAVVLIAGTNSGAGKTGLPLVVRVLDAPESLAVCREEKIPEEMIIAGRGPFSIEENISAITSFGIGTMVTKESGKAGGIDAKLAAARVTKCRLIVIRRPSLPASGPVFGNIPSLLKAVDAHIASLV